MALPFLVSSLSYVSYVQLFDSKKKEISTDNLERIETQASAGTSTGGAKTGPGGLKRSESEYSLGLTRNKAFNADINEVGSFCTTGELVLMSVKLAAGLALAGAVVAQVVSRKSD